MLCGAAAQEIEVELLYGFSRLLAQHLSSAEPMRVGTAITLVPCDHDCLQNPRGPSGLGAASIHQQERHAVPGSALYAQGGNSLPGGLAKLVGRAVFHLGATQVTSVNTFWMGVTGRRRRRTGRVGIDFEALAIPRTPRGEHTRSDHKSFVATFPEQA
jgi:hypothetical protein